MTLLLQSKTRNIAFYRLNFWLRISVPQNFPYYNSSTAVTFPVSAAFPFPWSKTMIVKDKLMFDWYMKAGEVSRQCLQFYISAAYTHMKNQNMFIKQSWILLLSSFKTSSWRMYISKASISFHDIKVCWAFFLIQCSNNLD